jgi:isoleucyl-tRNA synthetase
MAVELKDTLLLPRTSFPMRADLVKREPARLEHWRKLDLFGALQRRRAGAPAFVLHDGPPFTNGDVHIGTALNKVLKDLVNRYKALRGWRTPFVPGWDCHGLPIEQKVARELQAEGRTVSTAELRAACDAFAETWIGRQRTQFQRLGVLADWAQEYKTKAPAFEAEILRTFAAFLDRGLVYRSKKPVYWSIPFETALAEAEVEYKEHTAPAIWVKFPVAPAEALRFGLPGDRPLSVVIWTTTPWTLPANLAIALHPEIEYVVADLGTERILVAGDLLPAVAAAAGLDPVPPVAHRLRGDRLERLETRHPFIDRAAPVVLADYVNVESGTGCVHTAPGHGLEDYQTGQKYGLEPYCPVGDDGRFLDDGQVPAALVGLTTLESIEDLERKRPSPANLGVLRILEATGTLLAKQKYVHSYPHCWRSKTPVVFRAVDQWFVSLDRGGLRAQAIAAIAATRWVPAWGENRIRGAVESRPDWCISRQRAWGVPIPAFYDPQKNAWLDAGVARAVADRVEQHGSNWWFETPAAQMLAGVPLPADWPAAADLVPGRDTLDVWLDSGSTHAAVLARGQGNTQWPADLYLEGSDQHRGWFQSSLWTSVIARGTAPYRSVLTHGFIVGEDGKKISKSGSYEKPPTSDNYVAAYGADVVRLWVASQDFTTDITVSDKILAGAVETYRLFRNTFRFQLANLHDFELARHAVPLGQLDALDRWALHQLATLVRDSAAAYDAFDFHRVVQLCTQFCGGTLSAVYHDVLKDRLYTLAPDHPLRRSSQTAIHHLFATLVRLLAPILVFTTDEAWSFARGSEFSEGSVHLEDWPAEATTWSDPAIDADFGALLQLRGQVNEALEALRQAGRIGKALDAALTLALPADSPLRSVVERHRDSLAELFIVSHVALAEAAEGAGLVAVHAQPAAELGFVRCPRCWRWVPALEPSGHGAVCPRCAQALAALSP